VVVILLVFLLVRGAQDGEDGQPAGLDGDLPLRCLLQARLCAPAREDGLPDEGHRSRGEEGQPGAGQGQWVWVMSFY